MSVHLHHTRQWTGWILGAMALSPFALCFGSPMYSAPPSDVTGRVTFSGRPVNGATICLDSGGQHVAYGLLEDDGSFYLNSMTWIDRGALPGRYKAHLYTGLGHLQLPSKYGNPETSGIEIDIAPGWNDFHIELR